MKAALLLIVWSLCPITSDADDKITVTVIGSVHNPGPTTLDRDRSVTGLLNRAQCSRDSRLNRIRIHRTQPKDQAAIYELRQFDPAGKTSAAGSPRPIPATRNSTAAPTTMLNLTVGHPPAVAPCSGGA